MCSCGKCGPCVRELYKNRLYHNKKLWTANNKEHSRNYIKEYKRKYRQSNEVMMKDRARNTAGRALRRGELKINAVCKCGSTENIEMHHRDYSKPLEVEVMCRKCHRELMESWGG